MNIIVIYERRLKECTVHLWLRVPKEPIKKIRMRGFLLPLFLFYCVLGADNRQLQPKVTETVRQCDTQALWWDITESASQDVLFELEFTAFQAAQWQVTVVKRSFSANTNVSIVDHSYDCSLVQWTVKPEELNVIKRQEFGCGDMNGRWWVIVKHDAQRARDFVLNLNTRSMYFSLLANLFRDRKDQCFTISPSSNWQK